MIIETCLAFARELYGDECIHEAWEDFVLGKNIPMDNTPEFDTIFIQWFVFNWKPIPIEETFSIKEYFSKELIAITCLTEKTYKFDSYQREFIRTICQQPFTFYAVVNVEHGANITLRNIFLQNDCTVMERQASQIVKPGDILFTRVLTINNISIMVGCAPVSIPSIFHIELLDLKKTLIKANKELNTQALCFLDPILRERYFDIANEACNPSPTRLCNTDGDPFVFVKLQYEITSLSQDVFNQLKSLMLDDMEPDKTSYDKSGNLKKVEFSWAKQGNKKHTDWDNTILGHIEIDGSSLTVEVNSEKRSNKIQSEIKKRLGKKAVLKDICAESPEERMAKERTSSSFKDRKQNREEERLNERPEVKAYLKEMMVKHWETWLDSKIPALKNKTPRQAAKTEEGRERLEALLLDFEGRNEEIDDPLRPDVKALRKELNLNQK